LVKGVFSSPPWARACQKGEKVFPGRAGLMMMSAVVSEARVKKVKREGVEKIREKREMREMRIKMRKRVGWRTLILSILPDEKQIDRIDNAVGV